MEPEERQTPLDYWPAEKPQLSRFMQVVNVTCAIPVGFLPCLYVSFIIVAVSTGGGGITATKRVAAVAFGVVYLTTSIYIGFYVFKRLARAPGNSPITPKSIPFFGLGLLIGCAVSLVLIAAICFFAACSE